MKERFEGEGRPQLVEAIKRQQLVGGNVEIANALIEAGELCEFEKDSYIVRQDGEDDDVYLLVAGSVNIVANANNVATRGAGKHIGEMAAIEPAQRRSADVVAAERLVTLKISSPRFMTICEQYPRIWLEIARELSGRLYARNKFIPRPNNHPSLFIISSVEALPVARQLVVGLEHTVLPLLWTNGVFFAGDFALEALEKQVGESDFAVAIAQPDDIVQVRGKEYKTLRDNVLFELGLFMGRLGRFRSILLHPSTKDLKLPSDLQGLTTISYIPPEKPEHLAARLGPACAKIIDIVQKHGVLKLLD